MADEPQFDSAGWGGTGPRQPPERADGPQFNSRSQNRRAQTTATQIRSTTAARLFSIDPTGPPTSDDYYTPPWVFDRMGLTFDLDVCAPPGGIPWIPADRHYTENDDGLAQPWHGRVWMNPPFTKGGPGPWVTRFIAHRNGVCLLPHSRARWHAALWATDAVFVDPNVAVGPLFKFVRDGSDGRIYMPVFLAAFGAECVDAIARVGPIRKMADG